MGKTTEITDSFVRLALRDPGDYGMVVTSGRARGVKEEKRALETLRRAACARLSKFDDEFGGARIVIETQDICEHCGAKWTEGDSPHNGGCCDEDAKLLEATEATPAK